MQTQSLFSFPFLNLCLRSFVCVCVCTLCACVRVCPQLSLRDSVQSLMRPLSSVPVTSRLHCLADLPPGCRDAEFVAVMGAGDQCEGLLLPHKLTASAWVSQAGRQAGRQAGS